jgi:hypothetical protein
MDYLSKLYDEMGAYPDALEWLEEKRFPTLQDAWDVCKRGDWMLWLIGRTTNRNDEAQLRKLTLAKARCAKLVLPLMHDKRSRHAVEVAERFGLGKATHQELDDATLAAAAAYDATYATYAAYAATTATTSTTATTDVAYSSANAAAVVAAAHATHTAYDAAYAAAHKNMLAQCAEEIRTVYPAAPNLE